jgi:DNA-binding transcriptional LysR family regulator
MVDHKLVTLLALVETGSYTKAARSLNLTQPAVSHHIRQLEEELNIQLFYRQSKTLELTPAGKILLKYAKRATVLYSNLLQSLEDQQAGISHFVVGITPTMEETLVPRVMAVYCASHPDSRITIFSDSIDNLYLRLKSHELDVAVAEGAMPGSGFTSVLLDTDYLCLIVGPSHPFARRGSVTLEELKGENLILRTRQAGTRKLFDNYLTSISDSIRNFHVILEMDNLNTIRELVSSGLGVSVISHSACRDAIQAGTLAEVPIQDFRLVREVNMVHNQDFSHPELLEELRRIYLTNE